LFATREYTQAIEAIQQANDHDVDHQHTKEISQQELKCQQAIFSQRGEESQEETLQRAMRDPEVAVRQKIIILFPWFFIVFNH
jgi:stress-induced-phosphoprotein 1